MFYFNIQKTGRQIHAVLRIFIFRFSWYELTPRKVTIRFEVSWGWDYKQYKEK